MPNCAGKLEQTGGYAAVGWELGLDAVSLLIEAQFNTG